MVEGNIFYNPIRDTADNGRITGIYIVCIDVTDTDALHASGWSSFGASHTGSQAEKDAGIDNVSHGDMADFDVFQMPSVYRFQSQSPAMFEIQLVTVIFLNPPLDSVPSLIRPVR